MNRSVTVFLDQLLGDEDRILKVVPFPRHESDQNILTKSQFTPMGRGAVSDNLAALDCITNLNDRFLIQAGILIGTDKLDQVINIDTGSGFVDFILINLDDNTTGVNTFNSTIMPGNNSRTGIVSNNPLHAGSDQRCISP